MSSGMRGLAAFGLVCVVSAAAQAVELERATFVPGVIGANLYTGLSSIGAEPEMRFPGCVQQPTRLFFGTTTQVGVRLWSTEEGRRDFLALLLEAKRSATPVTMSYAVASNGFCYFRGLAF